VCNRNGQGSVHSEMVSLTARQYKRGLRSVKNEVSLMMLL
jgi:hypothetical protein